MSSKHLDCPECQGEGYLLTLGSMEFSSRFEIYQESESYERCNLCQGEGVLEVCANCLEVFKIVRGIEVCGCESLKLPKAA
jgi:RecJ-like exonuclease